METKLEDLTNHDLKLLQGFDSDQIHRLVHNFGHFVMAKHFRIDIQLKSSSDEHDLKPLKFPAYSEEDINLGMIIVYLAGSLAEDIYTGGNISKNPTAYSDKRYDSDNKFLHQYIMQDLKNRNVKSNYSNIKEIPREIYGEYAYYTQANFELIAQNISMTPQKLFQKGLLNMWLEYKKKLN